MLGQIKGTNISLSNINKIRTSERTKFAIISDALTFTALPNVYDAYKDDIAVVNVYFSSPIVMKLSTTVSKTWIDFISGIGGNVGIFVGFSFVTVFELIWLAARLVKLYIVPH